jgi:predicted glycosyltransferase
VKKILFDLDMGKWALFFYPIMKELKKRDISFVVTSRGGEGYSELNEILDLYKIDYISIGEYGGSSLEGKLKASIDRQLKLIDIINKHNIDTIISGSVVDATRVGFGLGKRVINFYDMPIKDYKTNLKKALPQIKLTIPLSSKVFKPFVVPDEVYLRLGLEKDQIVEYNFIDPMIWLKDFKFDEYYVKKFYKKYGIDRSKFSILVREEEYKASYVRKKYPFLYEVLPEIYKKFNANVIIIPRYESNYLKKEFPFAFIIEEKIILQHLLKDVDLFIGGGGTINSEACFLGTPTISTRSFISHYDKWQIDNGLMVWANNKNKLVKYVEMAKNGLLKPNLKALEKMEVNLNTIVNEILKG